MIVEYNRPKTIEEALTLLARTEPVTVPLGGGSVLNRPSPDPLAVVDLQGLGLDTVRSRGNKLELGSTVTLQTLLGIPELPAAFIRAIYHEATYNLRQVATLAGTLVAADGRSPLTTALLAMDTTLRLKNVGSGSQINLGDLLPVRVERLRGQLITRITLPLNVHLAYEYVARSPADRPIVCVALAQWSTGRTRVAVGGYGEAPYLAMDGPEPGGAVEAAESAYSHAEDEWASAEYRRNVAATLAGRCLHKILEE